MVIFIHLTMFNTFSHNCLNTIKMDNIADEICINNPFHALKQYKQSIYITPKQYKQSIYKNNVLERIYIKESPVQDIKTIICETKHPEIYKSPFLYDLLNDSDRKYLEEILLTKSSNESD